jgi:hypothetical protein
LNLLPANCARISTGPRQQAPQSGDLLLFPLAEHLNPKHELVLLDDAID